MQLTDKHIKLVLGLKLKNHRIEQNLSLSDLSKLSNLSISYINEIESGKKYPKIDKLQSLAKALKTSYESLVSLKLTKNLKPISELLESNLLNILPLHHYGIDINKLIATMASASAPVGALISAFIETARGSEMSKNSFSKTALRTFKEFHDDYFPELEEAVVKFRKEFHFDSNLILDYNSLSKILVTKFNYNLDLNNLITFSELSTLRASYFPKTKTLSINKHLTDTQKAFIIGKEIAYNYLGIKERNNLHSEKALATFDELLNNFYASYFANALLLPKDLFIDKLSEFFDNSTYRKSDLLSLPNFFSATPEMIFQRITNLLSKQFGINRFFFLRFNNNVDSNEYYLTKELRLNAEQNPGGTRTDLHYCRRWLSIKILEEMKAKVKHNPNFNNYLTNTLRSTFYNTENEYLNFSLAKHRRLSQNNIYSVTIGILLNETSKKQIKFWSDKKIKQTIVNNTCETCSIQNCNERVAEPHELEQLERNQKFDIALNKLSELIKL